MKPYGLKPNTHAEPYCDCPSAVRKVFCTCNSSKRNKRRGNGAKAPWEKVAYQAKKSSVRQTAKRMMRQATTED